MSHPFSWGLIAAIAVNVCAATVNLATMFWQRRLYGGLRREAAKHLDRCRELEHDWLAIRAGMVLDDNRRDLGWRGDA